MKSQPKVLKKIILEVCKALVLLQDQKAVHGSIRTSSILANISSKGIVKSVKLYGFDKWFDFRHFQERLESFSCPFIPPEVLNFIMYVCNYFRF